MTTAVAERAGTTGALTEALEGEFAQLRLSELVESPLNPRKHFDEKELKDPEVRAVLAAWQ